ncbi:MAG TPA: glycoside hydrolase family 32 protein [Thermomicrobiales bacterium]|nr:glycoside hydrolase family 32 protein [Thermomicrobiales bacterium]
MTAPVEHLPDPHRPTWHFVLPANWMNDPNGLCQWKGTYHLFYQHNPHGAFWGTMHWGHARSKDLVHWEHMPIALAPDPDGPDADGCFSGCMANVDGVATMLYTGVRGDAQLTCIATSQDDDLITWEKYLGNPVIAALPAELDTTIFRDHSVWRENGIWYQIIGSGIRGVGGTALLYRSSNFYRWEFVDSLVELDRVSQGIGKGATGWECPDFFALDGRHVLVASMWDQEPIVVAYFVGDYADHRFTPTHEGVLDPGTAYYAPQTLTDEAGRQIQFGWVREQRSTEAQIEAGWSGVMSLPRVLSLLPDGSLAATPASEVETLRGRHVRLPGGQIVAGEPLPLDGISGNSLELLVTLDPSFRETVAIEVLRSEDGGETTIISFDATSGTLTLNTTGASHSGQVEGGVYALRHVGHSDDAVTLRIFVDHSVVEVFLNDARPITARAYPESLDATGVTVSTPEGVASIDIWEMRP